MGCLIEQDGRNEPKYKRTVAHSLRSNVAGSITDAKQSKEDNSLRLLARRDYRERCVWRSSRCVVEKHWRNIGNEENE